MSEFDSEFVIFDKEQHDRSTFDCGEVAITNYLRKQAAQYANKNISQTFVLPSNTPLRTNDKFPIIAFFSLSSSQIKIADLPSSEAKKLPDYPVPAILIGQLGVHESFKGRKLGSHTLVQALKRCYEVSKSIGAYAVLVDCLNDDIVKFYCKMGFQELSSDAQKVRMFIPMKTIKQLL